jgi:hypothetical protein
MICLREPSLGPCFGVKGGATGGGYAQVLPMEDINLHFTGDFHAITSANNLLAAMLDNHIYWGNELGLDARRISWRRAIDMNDRALRGINSSLGGVANGFPREDGFDITVASEVMAVFCLARDLPDLQQRLGRMVVGQTRDGKQITAADVKADVLMPMAGGFRDPFGGMPSSRRSLKLKSNSIEITVKELPPGKPEGFGGAVGSFRVMGRADGPGAGPWTVQLGDPVAFELAVTGTGNFDTVGAPVLEDAAGFRTYPAKVAQENRDWGLEPGQKVFSQLVFPEKAGTMKAVYALSFFNPATGKYETVKTEPLELVVTGQPEAAVPAAGAGGEGWLINSSAGQ